MTAAHFQVNAKFDKDRYFQTPRALSYGYRVTSPVRPDSALNIEFTRHRAALGRYFRARGAGEEAEDLIQDLWLKLEAMAPEAAIDDPRSYLFRMAHNLMLDRHRGDRRRRQREQFYLDASDYDGAGADPSPSPDRVMQARQQLNKVQAVLSALGERTDYIFRRHRIERISQKQIATELGLSLSAVEKHLQKAYKAVQALCGHGEIHDDLS